MLSLLLFVLNCFSASNAPFSSTGLTYNVCTFSPSFWSMGLKSKPPGGFSEDHILPGIKFIYVIDLRQVIGKYAHEEFTSVFKNIVKQ